MSGDKISQIDNQKELYEELLNEMEQLALEKKNNTNKKNKLTTTPTPAN